MGLANLFCVQHVGEALEKLCGQFFGGALDQTAAQLCQFSADLDLGIIAEHCRVTIRDQRHICAALGVASRPAIALPGQ